GPGKPRVAALAGCRDRRHDLAARGIDLVDPRFGDLVEMAAVECRAGVARAVERSRRLATGRVEGDQLRARRRPDAAAVVADPVDLVGAGERAVFTHDPGGAHR